MNNEEWEIVSAPPGIYNPTLPMQNLTPEKYVSLVLAKVDILKLKADHYTWSHIGRDAQKGLESTLEDIDFLLTKFK